MGTNGRLSFPRAVATVIGLVAALGVSSPVYGAGGAAAPQPSSCVETRINGGPGLIKALAGSSTTDVWGIAVGPSWFQTTLYHFDGTVWSLVASPAGGQLNGLVALSPTNAWAVGGAASGTLIEHWNGSAWSVVPSRNPVASSSAILNGIAAASPTDIWAAGSYFNTAFNGTWALTEHWDGSRWHIVPSRHPSTNTWLKAVTVIASNDVWAVGGASGVLGSSSLFEHWDGLSWGWLRQANGPSLDSVSAASSTDVWAIGTINSSTDQALEPVFDHWDGTVWRVAPWTFAESPNGRPWPGGNFMLYNVVAVSPTSVFAFGQEEEEFGLLGQWDGTQWAVRLWGDTSIYSAASIGGMVWLGGTDSVGEVVIDSCSV